MVRGAVEHSGERGRSMVSSNLEQYTVADFVQWHDEKRLVLNPHFQRNLVWTPAAKTYLIDTILLRLPIPKIFVRSKIDLTTKKSVREVVDGQQRLNAILEFAADNLTLSSRSEGFAGYKYSTLPDELKQSFLSYSLGVDNLINASDDDVLSIFGRLNSYGISLNAAEKRHAQYQGEFKWTVYKLTEGVSKSFWDDFGVLSITQRARMADYALVAECLGLVIEGVTDGGEAGVTKLYAKYDVEIPNQTIVVDRYQETVRLLTGPLGTVLTGAVSRPPHFVMLFASAAHTLFGLPRGGLSEAEFPEGSTYDPGKLEEVRQAVATLSGAIDSANPPHQLDAFVTASKSSTQRISSRRIRFPFYWRAMQGRLS